jgi:hypothetical protein
VGAVIIFGATTIRTWLEARNAKVLARVAPAP